MYNTKTFTLALIGSLATFTKAQDISTPEDYQTFYEQQLSFSQGFYKHIEPNNKSYWMNLDEVAPATDDAWSTNPSYDEVSANICTSDVPVDQWNWIETRYRFFHTEDADEVYSSTGDLEITLTNIDTAETWECHGGHYTTEADASNGAIRYYDYAVPEGHEVQDFGFYWTNWTERPEHTKTTAKYDYIGFYFEFRSLDDGNVMSTKYAPSIVWANDNYYTGSYSIKGNVVPPVSYTRDRVAQRLIAVNFFPEQQKGDVVTPVTSPYQKKFPTEDINNQRYLKYVATLTTTTDVNMATVEAMQDCQAQQSVWTSAGVCKSHEQICTDAGKVWRTTPSQFCQTQEEFCAYTNGVWQADTAVCKTQEEVCVDAGKVWTAASNGVAAICQTQEQVCTAGGDVWVAASNGTTAQCKSPELACTDAGKVWTAASNGVTAICQTQEQVCTAGGDFWVAASNGSLAQCKSPELACTDAGNVWSDEKTCKTPEQVCTAGGDVWVAASNGTTAQCKSLEQVCTDAGSVWSDEKTCKTPEQVCTEAKGQWTAASNGNAALCTSQEQLCENEGKHWSETLGCTTEEEYCTHFGDTWISGTPGTCEVSYEGRCDLIDDGYFVKLDDGTSQCVTFAGSALSTLDSTSIDASECVQGCASWGTCIDDADSLVCDQVSEGNYIFIWLLVSVFGVGAMVTLCCCCKSKDDKDKYQKIEEEP